MRKKRDRPKQKKVKKTFSLKKSFESFKQKLKILKLNKSKTSKKPKAKKTSFKNKFNNFKAKMKNIFKMKLSNKKTVASKKQNASKFSNVDFEKIISAVLIFAVIMTSIGLLGNIGGTKTVVKQPKPETPKTESVTDINGVVRQYKVNAGQTVNAGDFVEFVPNWGEVSLTECNSTIFKAISLSLDKIAVVYAVPNAIRCAILSLTENSYECIFDNNLYYCEGASFSHVDVDKVNDTDLALGCCYSLNNCYNFSIFVVRFTNNFTDVQVGSDLTFENYMFIEGFALSSMTDGKIAYVLEHHRDSSRTFCTRGLVLYDVYTLDYVDCFDTGNTGGPEINYISDVDICALDDFHFVTVFSSRYDFWYADTGGISLISYGDNAESGGRFIRVNATTWYCVGRYIHKFVYENGILSFSKGSDAKYSYIPASSLVIDDILLVKSNGYINTYLLNSLNKQSSLLYSNSIYFDFVSLSQRNFLGVMSDGKISIKQFTLLDDNSVQINDIEKVGLFIQKATSNNSLIGIAKTSGKEGDIIEVYCVK